MSFLYQLNINVIPTTIISSKSSQVKFEHNLSNKRENEPRSAIELKLFHNQLHSSKIIHANLIIKLWEQTLCISSLKKIKFIRKEDRAQSVSCPCRNYIR
jgi:hypothetical protein